VREVPVGRSARACLPPPPQLLVPAPAFRPRPSATEHPVSALSLSIRYTVRPRSPPLPAPVVIKTAPTPRVSVFFLNNNQILPPNSRLVDGFFFLVQKLLQIPGTHPVRPTFFALIPTPTPRQYILPVCSRSVFWPKTQPQFCARSTSSSSSSSSSGCSPSCRSPSPTTGRPCSSRLFFCNSDWLTLTLLARS
jgi:hypothetical protein